MSEPDVEYDASKSTRTAEGVAREIVRRGVAPEAAAACAHRVFRGGWRTEKGGATARFFDLASVTKPFTAMAVALSGLRVGSPLRDLLPELDARGASLATLELLLAHRAGLEALLPLYAPLLRGEEVLFPRALEQAADALRPGIASRVAPPTEGYAPVYSDLGYILAGAALARFDGAVDAAEAIERRVIRPLGIEDHVGSVRALESRGHRLAEAAAPTEDVKFRGGVIRGCVHDENAWALTTRGGSGHAGLFGTVEGVLAFGRAVCDALSGESSLFGSLDLTWVVRPRPGSSLRAGFDAKSYEGYSSAGERMGPRAIGHLGFTGTSLWIDPDARVVVTLLTNRVHPTRDHAAIREARPWAHDALFERALALT